MSRLSQLEKDIEAVVETTALNMQRQKDNLVLEELYQQQNVLYRFGESTTEAYPKDSPFTRVKG